MNKHLKRKKAIRIKNRKFLKKYPFAAPVDWWGWKISPKVHKYDFTAWDDIPIGWRKAFGSQLAEDLKEACIKSHFPMEKLVFCQIKEKYGELRMYNYGATTEVQEVIDDYEVISRNCCMYCGRPDAGVTEGWIEPICRTCWNKKYKEPYDLVEVRIPDSYKVNHYDKDNVVAEVRIIKYKVDKIRKKYGN